MDSTRGRFVFNARVHRVSRDVYATRNVDTGYAGIHHLNIIDARPCACYDTIENGENKKSHLLSLIDSFSCLKSLIS